MSAKKKKQGKELKKISEQETIKEQKTSQVAPPKTSLKGSLRPMILGDESMALKLHAYFMSDESFNLFDMKSMFEKNYEPNLILLFGPVKERMKKRLAELRGGLGNHKLIFIQELSAPEEEEEACQSGRDLGADFVLAKRFPTLENIKEMIEKVADV